MKSINNIKFIIVLAIALFCINSLKAQSFNLKKIENDTLWIEYKNVSLKLKNNMQNGTYKIPNQLNQSFFKLFLTNKPQQVAFRLKEEGMENAEKFVEDLVQQVTLMNKLITKYHELKKVDRNQLTEMITAF